MLGHIPTQAKRNMKFFWYWCKRNTNKQSYFLHFSEYSYNLKMDCVFRVEEVNAMGNEQFVSVFNNIVESYPQAAIAICNQRPFASADHLADAASNYLELLPIHGNNII